MAYHAGIGRQSIAMFLGRFRSPCPFMNAEEVSDAEASTVVDHEDDLHFAYPRQFYANLLVGKENEDRAEASMVWGSSLFLKADDTPRPLEGKVWTPEKLFSE